MIRRSGLTLSAAMIVRDEAVTLGDCLRSMRDLVDETVVVDTGSTDGTPEIAARLGARVFGLPWGGDFAAARNEALRHVRGGWILYIDADERVSAGARDGLEGLLGDGGAVACTVRFRPRSGFTRYRECRIFRNDPRIRFRGVIHETMLPDVQEVAARDGLRIAPSALAIDHLGYDGDRTRKHVRDLPLLRARLSVDPGHVYSWTHLGHALAGLGDGAGARAAWWRAIQVVRRSEEPAARHSLPYLALIQDGMDGGGVPGDLLGEATARFPGNHVLTWLRGRVLVAQERFTDAAALFESLGTIDPETLVDDHLAYDGRLFGTWAAAALALCHFRLGRYAESARHYARAEALDPDDPGHRIRRLLAEARVGRAATDTAGPALAR